MTLGKEATEEAFVKLGFALIQLSTIYTGAFRNFGGNIFQPLFILESTSGESALTLMVGQI